MPHKTPARFADYDGPRLTCFHCGRVGVPAPDGVLMVLHRRPERNSTCPFGGGNLELTGRSVITTGVTAPVPPPLVAGGAAYAPEKKKARSRQKTLLDTGRFSIHDSRMLTLPVERGEAPDNLARRPCPKCSTLVTWSDGIAWPHACGSRP